MTNKFLLQTIEAVLESDETLAKECFSKCFESMAKEYLSEDHQKSMTPEELLHYIKTLDSKAKKEHKETFAKHLEVDECNDENFSKCSKTLAKDPVKADKVIHKLERLVGYAIDPEVYKGDKDKGESDEKAEKDSKKDPKHLDVKKEEKDAKKKSKVSESRLISRDSFARSELHRTPVAVGEHETCSNCGQQKQTKTGKKYLFKYHTENDDSGRKHEHKGKFCSKDCHDSYHGL